MRKVKTKWTINLPSGSVPKVKVGQMVVCGQELAQESVIRELMVSMASQLKGWQFSQIKKMETELLGKDVVAGKVMYESGGFFSKKILSPESGRVIKIDEFKNMYLSTSLSNKLVSIKSPTEAKVIGIGVDVLELEFRADEFSGVGLNDDRAWGINGLKLVKNIGDLSTANEGKIIVVAHISPDILLKAEVVGIKGVVVTEECDLRSKLPMLKLVGEDCEAILKEANSSRRALLNAGSGRLLLVI